MMDVEIASILMPLLFLGVVCIVTFLALVGLLAQYLPLLAVVITACFAMLLLGIVSLVAMGKRNQ
jgi:hypothetical protein